MNNNLLKNLIYSKDFLDLQWFLSQDFYAFNDITFKSKSHLPQWAQEIKFLLFCIKHSTFFQRKISKKKIAFYNSYNQYRSLKGIIENYDISSYTFDYVNNSKKLKILVFDLFSIALLVIRHSKFLRKNCCNHSYYFQHLKPILHLAALNRSLNLKTLDTVFISNDHRPENRIFLFLQKKTNLRVVYKQHSQVSKYFPPLDWTISILDGESTLDIYNSIGGISSEIILTGLDSTESLIKTRTYIDSHKIGLALNSLDELDFLADQIILFFQNHKITKFFLRPHPNPNEMQHRVLKNMIQKFKHNGIAVIVSDGLLEDFLKNISICIAGESSILLEAAIANKVCIKHSYCANDFQDYYGFIKHGLASTFDDLINTQLNTQLVTNMQLIQKQNARYFSSTLGTDEEGRELDVLLKALRNRLN
jgi:hypothetical protein